MTRSDIGSCSRRLQDEQSHNFSPGYGWMFNTVDSYFVRHATTSGGCPTIYATTLLSS